MLKRKPHVNGDEAEAFAVANCRVRTAVALLRDALREAARQIMAVAAEEQMTARISGLDREGAQRLMLMLQPVAGHWPLITLSEDRVLELMVDEEGAGYRDTPQLRHLIAQACEAEYKACEVVETPDDDAVERVLALAAERDIELESVYDA